MNHEAHLSEERAGKAMIDAARLIFIFYDLLMNAFSYVISILFNVEYINKPDLMFN